MNRFFTLLFAASCLTAVGQTEYPYPYNPDGNNDGYISLNDLLDLLSVYGSEFNAGVLATDSISAVYYTGELDYYDCASSCVSLRGNWKMLDKDLVGSYKSKLSEYGGTGTWLDLRNAPIQYWNGSGLAPLLNSNWTTGASATNTLQSCFCQTRSRADIEDINVCEGLEDECGLCNGEGAIYECGCSDIPEGDCDCEGNQLDAIGVCGGDCLEDADGDGICDPVFGPCEGEEVITYHGVDYEIVETADGRCWFAEDLKTWTFRDSTSISTSWDYSNNAYFHPDFLPSYLYVIGGQEWKYNFGAVQDSRGICPVGWEVPSRQEWLHLDEAYSSSSSSFLELMGDSFIAGFVLPYSSNGTAGLNLASQTFVRENGSSDGVTPAIYWSRTQVESQVTQAYSTSFNFESFNPNGSFTSFPIGSGLSVRCIKDTE